MRGMAADLVAGQFLVRRKLGEGRAGIVFEATVTKDTPYAKRGSRVALKRYKQAVLEQEEQAGRVERELLSSTSVASPHVVRALDLVKDGDTYLVMELLDGEPLSAWLGKNRERTFDQTMEILAAIVSGVRALHKAGLIHRDVKTDNIMMTSRGPVITDLGVVKPLEQDTVSTGNHFLGTIRYSAPEYLFGETYDSEIDTYGIGTILWEMVYGQALIEKEVHWTKQVLLKRENASIPQISMSEKLAGLTARHTVFLGTLLSGMLATRKHRFSLEQIFLAICDRAWDHPFLTWACIGSDFERAKWPSLPDRLKNQYDLLLGRIGQAKMQAIVDYILWDAARPRSWPPPNDITERYLEDMGLGDSEMVPGVGNDYEHLFWLKPFAYQVLACHSFERSTS